MAALCAGKRLGSSGLWKDRGPADHDRTGPSVSEPLPNIWLHLSGPCALKPHKQHYNHPTTETSTKSCKRQSREDKLNLFTFEAGMHCQGRPQKTIGTVFSIFQGPNFVYFYHLWVWLVFIYTRYQVK